MITLLGKVGKTTQESYTLLPTVLESHLFVPRSTPEITRSLIVYERFTGGYQDYGGGDISQYDPYDHIPVSAPYWKKNGYEGSNTYSIQIRSPNYLNFDPPIFRIRHIPLYNDLNVGDRIYWTHSSNTGYGDSAAIGFNVWAFEGIVAPPAIPYQTGTATGLYNTDNTTTSPPVTLNATQAGMIFAVNEFAYQTSGFTSDFPDGATVPGTWKSGAWIELLRYTKEQGPDAFVATVGILFHNGITIDPGQIWYPNPPPALNNNRGRHVVAAAFREGSTGPAYGTATPAANAQAVDLSRVRFTR